MPPTDHVPSTQFNLSTSQEIKRSACSGVETPVATAANVLTEGVVNDKQEEEHHVIKDSSDRVSTD